MDLSNQDWPGFGDGYGVRNPYLIQDLVDMLLTLLPRLKASIAL